MELELEREREREREPEPEPELERESEPELELEREPELEREREPEREPGLERESEPELEPEREPEPELELVVATIQPPLASVKVRRVSGNTIITLPSRVLDALGAAAGHYAHLYVLGYRSSHPVLQVTFTTAAEGAGAWPSEQRRKQQKQAHRARRAGVSSRSGRRTSSGR